MTETELQLVEQARNGNIESFQELFAPLQAQLKSYLFRMFANRNDAEDCAHDTFVKAFATVHSFRAESSFKTWLFRIATNLALDELRKRKRWVENVQDKARELARYSDEIKAEFRNVHTESLQGNFDIREHIDCCFTCISKTLVLEQQVALLLKDVYDFTVREIAQLLDQSEGIVKHLLLDARKNMSQTFERRCALINKDGTCYQCSELNSFFNPGTDASITTVTLDLVKAADRFNAEELLELRTILVKQIDPLRSDGSELQEVILKCSRKVMGEA